MTSAIEDHALLGNTRGAALVDRHGSVDWLCVPRFDSAACLAALLGGAEHGRFRLAPQGGAARVTAATAPARSSSRPRTRRPAAR